MKSSFLIGMKEFFARRSKTPWACFETEGPDNNGGMEFRIRWNNAFVRKLRRHGYEGDDEEVVHLFFLATRVLPEQLLNEVNPEATPRLTSEANSLVK